MANNSKGNGKKNGPGRPRKNIDPQQVEELAAIQCSYAEMAAVLKCDPSTLTRNYSQAIKDGRERGKSSLKRKQYEVAMKGNVGMLIWLGKQHLGQSDKYESQVDQYIEVDDRRSIVDELLHELDAMNERQDGKRQDKRVH